MIEALFTYLRFKFSTILVVIPNNNTRDSIQVSVHPVLEYYRLQPYSHTVFGQDSEFCLLKKDLLVLLNPAGD